MTDGHNPRMDGHWFEAMSAVQAQVDAELREEAVDLYLAEAARLRLSDRDGPVRIVLRCGVVVRGDLVARGAPDIQGWLRMVSGADRELLVSCWAIVALRGSAARLRDEDETVRSRSLPSLLREHCATGEPLRALLGDGRWLEGRLVRVAADHVEMQEAADQGAWVLPLSTVEAWDLGAGAGWS